MINGILTKVIIESDSGLKLFDSTASDAFNRLGFPIDDYAIKVGSELEFEDLAQKVRKGQVTEIRTEAYKTLQRVTSDNDPESGPFQLTIIYTIKLHGQ